MIAFKSFGFDLPRHAISSGESKVIKKGYVDQYVQGAETVSHLEVGAIMCDRIENIRRLNGMGFSNRAIARELGISRESVNKAVRSMGAVSPFARPVRVLPRPVEKARTYRRGDILMHFQGEGEDCTIPLRAVVIKRYKRFTHCRVEALQDGRWNYIYDQCFD